MASDRFFCPHCGAFIGDITPSGWLTISKGMSYLEIKEGKVLCQCERTLYWYAKHHASREHLRSEARRP